MQPEDIAVPRDVLKSRAVRLWFTVLLGGVCILPLIAAVLMARRWHEDAFDTRYESHMIAGKRVGLVGLGVFGLSLATVTAGISLGMIAMLGVGIFVLGSAISGLRRASAERLFPPFAYVFGLRSREALGWASA